MLITYNMIELLLFYGYICIVITSSKYNPYLNLKNEMDT